MARRTKAPRPARPPAANTPKPTREDDTHDASVRAMVRCPWCGFYNRFDFVGTVGPEDGQTIRCGVEVRPTCSGDTEPEVVEDGACGRVLVVTGEASVEWWASLTAIPPTDCENDWHGGHPLAGPEQCPGCGARASDNDKTMPMFEEPPAPAPAEPVPFLNDGVMSPSDIGESMP